MISGTVLESLGNSEDGRFSLSTSLRLSHRPPTSMEQGDGQRYKMILRTDPGWDSIAYCHSFDTRKGEWHTVRIAFPEFFPVFRAKTLKVSREQEWLVFLHTCVSLHRPSGQLQSRMHVSDRNSHNQEQAKGDKLIIEAAGLDGNSPSSDFGFQGTDPLSTSLRVPPQAWTPQSCTAFS